jgi:hypothetical protein
MITKLQFVKQFRVVWYVRQDLSDGMETELREVLNEMKTMNPEEKDYTNLAQWTDDILNDWGYSGVFQLEDVCQQEGHQWEMEIAVEPDNGSEERVCLRCGISERPIQY